MEPEDNLILNAILSRDKNLYNKFFDKSEVVDSELNSSIRDELKSLFRECGGQGSFDDFIIKILEANKQHARNSDTEICEELSQNEKNCDKFTQTETEKNCDKFIQTETEKNCDKFTQTETEKNCDKFTQTEEICETFTQTEENCDNSNKIMKQPSSIVNNCKTLDRPNQILYHFAKRKIKPSHEKTFDPSQFIIYKLSKKDCVFLEFQSDNEIFDTLLYRTNGYVKFKRNIMQTNDHFKKIAHKIEILNKIYKFKILEPHYG